MTQTQFETAQSAPTTIACTDWLGDPVEIVTDLDIEELWLSCEYVGVRVVQGGEAAVGDTLDPSVDMPDGDIRHECSMCSHATGGESQRGDCECGDCDGVECDHDMQPVVLDGTCVFYGGGSLSGLYGAIREAVKYSTSGRDQIVIVGSDQLGRDDTGVVVEYMGALVRSPEVIGVLRAGATL
jgi:hypothetical protein